MSLTAGKRLLDVTVNYFKQLAGKGNNMNRRSFLKALSVIPFVGGLAVAKPEVAAGEFTYKGYTFRLNERDSSHTYLSASEWQVYLAIDGKHGGCYVEKRGFNLQKRNKCCDILIMAAERSVPKYHLGATIIEEDGRVFRFCKAAQNIPKGCLIDNVGVSDGHGWIQTKFLKS